MATMEPKTQALVRIAAADAAMREQAVELFKLPYPTDQRLRIVAGLAHPNRLVGCAALFASLSEQGERGLLLTVRTLPAWHDGDLFERLLQAAVCVAGRSGGAKLQVHDLLADGSVDAQRMLDAGFQVVENLETYQAPYKNVLTRSTRILEAARSRRAIPERASIGGLTREHLGRIRTLFHEQQIMTATEIDLRLGSRHPQPINAPGSTLCRVDDQLVGAMLIAPLPDPKGYLVTARWVHPDYRNSWVNAALLAHSCRQVEPLGLEYVRFLGNTAKHDETARLATRLGGFTAERKARMELRLV